VGTKPIDVIAILFQELYVDMCFGDRRMIYWTNFTLTKPFPADYYIILVIIFGTALVFCELESLHF